MKIIKRLTALTIFITLLMTSASVFAHPGRLDKNNGHKCSATAKANGLCTEYHYHHETQTTTRNTPEKTTPATTSTNIAIIINGTKQTYAQPPRIEDNTTLVPLRGIFETLNATVNYDAKTKVIHAVKGSTNVTLTLGSKNAKVNSKAETLLVPAKAINGSTLVPLRFISQSLGADVQWSAATKTITITDVSVQQAPVASTFEAIVADNVDGDTVKIKYDNDKVETVRLLLVDTPETVHPTKPVQPFGKEASDLAKTMMAPGTKVKVELDVSERDKYGRLLAYIYVGDKMFNEVLLEKGLARVAYVYTPNTRYVDQFRAIEKKAKAQGVGIWSIENYVQDSGFISD